MMQYPIKILLIEARLQETRRIKSLLADTRATLTHTPSYEILVTDRLNTALAYIQNIPFDLILLAGSFSDALAQIVAVGRNAPIILLGSQPVNPTGIQFISQGVQDYLLKNELTASQLQKAIHLAIARQKREATIQQQANSQEQYQQMIEANADGIVLVRKDGIVLFANTAAAHILRQNKDDLIGHRFSLPLPKDDTAEFNISRENDQASSIEIRMVELEWEGEWLYQASLRDITTHQRAKAAIRQKAQELEIRNMALDDFGHTMAHQVQGLLSQMMGYASYLEMRYQDEIGEEFDTAVGRIVQSGHKMNNVISELLLLASIRSGDTEVEPLNMQRVVTEALKRMRYQIEQNKVQIIHPPSWPVPLGHGPWIEEAWVNYISNGIKYGGSPPVLEVGSNKLDEGAIRFWVKDNGPGIPVIDQKLLFKPHTRLGPKRVRGEGLGLSIVRRIVAKCGGQVGVESHEDGGSLFWFSLPEATAVKISGRS
ncbi:MAG: PAS domain S-box protein [Chloroflexi bacterium]|nr:PAS domain S-box protein [Chloroflexota bacterium]